MFVQGFYRIGRRTLRRTVPRGYAYGERRDREDDNEGTPSFAPGTFEICQVQHSRLTGPIYFLPYSRAWTQETGRNYRNREDNCFDTPDIRLVASSTVINTVPALKRGGDDWPDESKAN